MSIVSEGFFKQLRKDVKNKASNYKLLKFIESVYEEGYRQGIKAATQRAQEMINATHENLNNGNPNDGIGLGTGSSEPQERSGPDAVDSHSGEGSEPGLRDSTAV